MDPLAEMLWKKYLAADKANDHDRKRTPKDLIREMLHDDAVNAMAALEELGYIVTAELDDAEGTGEIVARDGENILMKKKA